jgi:DNA-binding beta-propeller fold protein YncE
MVASAPFPVLVLTAVLSCGLAACEAPAPLPPPSSRSGPSTLSPLPPAGPTSAAPRVASTIAIADGPESMVVDPNNELYTSDHGTVVLIDIGQAETGKFPGEAAIVGSDSGDLAFDAEAGLLYVATENRKGAGTVTVLNVDRRFDDRTGKAGEFKVIDTIELGKGRLPDQLGLDAGADALFVLSSTSEMVVIDTRSRKVTGRIRVGYRDDDGHQQAALALAVDPRAGTVIVGSTGRSWVIETKSLHVKTVDTDGGGPMTVDPTTGHGFIPREGEGTVTVVDTTTGTVVKTISVGFRSGTGPVAVDASAGLAYLPVAGALVVIDTSTLEVVKRIPPPEGSDSWRALVVDPSTGFFYMKAGGNILVVKGS